jgi:hypothetical protein
MQRRTLAVPTLLLCATVPAVAQTFVVDAAGGGAFTSVAAAIAVVPDGAVLLVRPGGYAGFTLNGKGLTILADPGAALLSSITISGTSASQPVRVRGFTGNSAGVTVSSCTGPVHLQDIRPVPATPSPLAVTQCSQVLVERCDFHGPWSGGCVVVSNCAAVAFVETSIRAVIGMGLSATSSDVLLVDASVHGGTTVSMAVVGNGIDLGYVGTSSVRLLGTTSVSAGGSLHPAYLPVAIGGYGSVAIGPAAVAATFGASLSVTPAAEAALTVTGGALGTATGATLRGDAGALGVLVLGIPGPALPFAGQAGGVWVDPASAVTVAAGVFGPALAANVTLPPNPLLLAQSFAWQGLTWSPGSGFAASNPGWFTIR